MEDSNQVRASCSSKMGNGSKMEKPHIDRYDDGDDRVIWKRESGGFVDMKGA
jgi:hypothetical protein